MGLYKRDIFSIIESAEITEWLLIQKYKFVDSNNYQTGSPYVTLITEDDKNSFQDCFCVLPIKCVVQHIQIINDPREDFQNNQWINWWISSGPWTYPFDQRRNIMKKYNWRK